MSQDFGSQHQERIGESETGRIGDGLFLAVSPFCRFPVSSETTAYAKGTYSISYPKYLGPTKASPSGVRHCGWQGMPKTIMRRPYFSASVVIGSPVCSSTIVMRSRHGHLRATITPEDEIFILKEILAVDPSVTSRADDVHFPSGKLRSVRRRTSVIFPSHNRRPCKSIVNASIGSRFCSRHVFKV